MIPIALALAAGEQLGELSNTIEVSSESEESLPAPEFRQDLLRRAQLTLAEARALVEVLDHLEAGVSCRTGWLPWDRAAFGVRTVGSQSLSIKIAARGFIRSDAP